MHNHGVIDEHLSRRNIRDLNEVAHDEDIIDTSLAIMPFVDSNAVITSQRELRNDLLANCKGYGLRSQSLSVGPIPMVCPTGTGQPKIPQSIQSKLNEQQNLRVETDWSLGFNPFNLDPFIYGNDDNMQGRKQRDGGFRNRVRKKTKGAYKNLPELRKRITHEQEGKMVEHAPKKQSVVMDSMSCLTVVAITSISPAETNELH
ncbi:hypothetical protein DVH24_027381 [Malus domestica]|uniref:Uncharacterized protein n=1 Tax=Malus domestica TaxID=3750 RepID=A0A498HDN8_MALDO|nr:hypothetical protein DVH24_027381 [Malus domestica]